MYIKAQQKQFFCRSVAVFEAAAAAEGGAESHGAHGVRHVSWETDETRAQPPIYTSEKYTFMINAYSNPLSWTHDVYKSDIKTRSCKLRLLEV